MNDHDAMLGQVSDALNLDALEMLSLKKWFDRFMLPAKHNISTDHTRKEIQIRKRLKLHTE